MNLLKINNISILLVLTVGLYFSSCTSRKEFVYFATTDSTKLTVAFPQSELPIIQLSDIVSISVSAIDPDVVRPFNMVPPQTSTIGQAGNMQSNMLGYALDMNGNIDFPVIGKIKLVGLNRIQAAETVREKLKTYVNNPIVNVRILNHKVSVLGEVRTPGIIPFNTDQLTIVDALALTGDIQISGMKNNVLVVREENGVKKEYRVDMTNPDVFKSPVYYLKNQDIIYVEPTKARLASSKPIAQYGAIVVGGTSLIVNLINVIINLRR